MTTLEQYKEVARHFTDISLTPSEEIVLNNKYNFYYNAKLWCGKTVEELTEDQFKTKVFQTLARPIYKGNLKPKERQKLLSEFISFFGRYFTIEAIGRAYCESCVNHQETLEYIKAKGWI